MTRFNRPITSELLVLEFIQILAGLAAVAGLFLIWAQLRNQSKHIMFEALDRLHKEITGPVIQRDLRLIYSAKPDDLATPTSVRVLESIERVLNMYDLIGFKIESGVLPKGPTIQTEWAIVLLLEHQLKPFRTKERERRGNVAPYKPHFQWLAKEAAGFQKLHFPTWKPVPFRRDVFLNSKPCVGVFILNEAKTQILLARRDCEPHIGQYDIPGGFLDYGEHPEAGALREVQEETHLSIKLEALIGIYMDTYEAGGDKTMNVAYRASKVSGIEKASSDVRELEWVSLEHALQKQFAFPWISKAIADLVQMMGRASETGIRPVT